MKRALWFVNPTLTEVIGFNGNIMGTNHVGRVLFASQGCFFVYFLCGRREQVGYDCKFSMKSRLCYSFFFIIIAELIYSIIYTYEVDGLIYSNWLE